MDFEAECFGCKKRKFGNVLCHGCRATYEYRGREHLSLSRSVSRLSSENYRLRQELAKLKEHLRATEKKRKRKP